MDVGTSMLIQKNLKVGNGHTAASGKYPILIFLEYPCFIVHNHSPKTTDILCYEIDDDDDDYKNNFEVF